VLLHNRSCLLSQHAPSKYIHKRHMSLVSNMFLINCSHSKLLLSSESTITCCDGRLSKRHWKGWYLHKNFTSPIISNLCFARVIATVSLLLSSRISFSWNKTEKYLVINNIKINGTSPKTSMIMVHMFVPCPQSLCELQHKKERHNFWRNFRYTLFLAGNDVADADVLLSVFVHEKIITSLSRPWYWSTVFTSTSLSMSRETVFCRSATWARNGAITPMLFPFTPPCKVKIHEIYK